jgi:hypothetical protein
MDGTGTKKSKSGSLEAEEELREKMGQREEGRRTNEQNEQQDLNQGIGYGNALFCARRDPLESLIPDEVKD